MNTKIDGTEDIDIKTDAVALTQALKIDFT